jgi:hypothetical protein
MGQLGCKERLLLKREKAMGVQSKQFARVSKGDNPAWKCEACGKQGACDYAGQGVVCKECAEERGF